MIQRTTLPNLAQQITKQKRSKTNFENNTHRYSTFKKELKILHNIKTQVSLNSQNTTLQMKLFDNSDIFHTKIKTLNQKHIDQNNVAPYFFKIHNGLKILQNTDDLNRKLTQTRYQQTQRLLTASIQNSKKKLQKKLIINSKSGTKSVDSISEKKFYETMKDTSQISINKNKQIKTQTSQMNSLSSTLKNRKKQLTENAKQAKYSFEHFNSGEIFTQIALINQKKLVMNQKANCYRVAEHGTYFNKMYNLKDKTKNKKIARQISEQFRDEYNTFLRNKLPSSFGENGNKSCIYQEFVLKRKQQEKDMIKSKLVQGKFLRTQPSAPQKQEFIFTNSIHDLSAKKMQMDNDFAQKQSQQHRRVKKYLTQNQQLKPDFSATTSKIVTKTNTKLNTLRQGQSFINKLKLKKLAKMQQKQKPKSLNKNTSLKSRTHSRNEHSSLSNYENSLSEAEFKRLMYKSNLILGKDQQGMQNPQLINYQQNLALNNKINQLNEYEQAHLSHIDKLLCKQQSILRTDRQDLDCLPWRISIKIQKRKNL